MKLPHLSAEAATKQTPPPSQQKEAKISTFARNVFKVVIFPVQAAAALTRKTVSVITGIASAIIGVPGRVLNAVKETLFPTKPEKNSEQEAVEVENTEPKSFAARLKEAVTLERGAAAVALVVGAVGLAITYNTIYGAPVQAIVEQVPVEAVTEQASTVAQYGYTFLTDLIQPQTSPIVEAVVEEAPTVAQYGYTFLTDLIQPQTSPIVEAVVEQAPTVAQYGYTFLTDLIQPQTSPIVEAVVEEAPTVAQYGYTFLTDLMKPQISPVVEAVVEQAPAVAQYGYTFLTDLVKSQASPVIEAVVEQASGVAQYGYTFLTDLMKPQTSPVVEAVVEQVPATAQYAYTFAKDLIRPLPSPVEIATSLTSSIKESSIGYTTYNGLKKLIPLTQKIKDFTPQYLKKTAGRASAVAGFFAVKKLCTWAKSGGGNQALKTRVQDMILATALTMFAVGYYNLPVDYTLSA